MKYLVQEFSAHQWNTIRTFDNEQAAQEFATKIAGSSWGFGTLRVISR